MPKNTFLMRLFFFAHLSPEERKAAIRGHLESLKETQRQLKSTRSKIEGRADFYQLQCDNFGLRFYQDIIRKVSQVLKALDKTPEKEP
jgi:Virulence activator alpha C-term